MKKCIVILDYYSKFFELEEIPRTTTGDIIKVFSQNFARHGCPEVMRSDNALQFGSTEFRQFAKEWGVELVTSSPYYPPSNEEAERAVQTAKNLLKKTSNSAQALLAHRTTPGPEGFSPAELLMGRKLRSTLPTAPSALRPPWQHSTRYRKRYRKRKTREASSYNRRHCTRNGRELHPHAAVGIHAGAASQGVVRDQVGPPRS
ncbi:uncharacterized protein ISCGN_003585 [Ixodes scapularis]